MPTTADRKITLGVRVQPRILAELKRRARDDDRSLSAYVRRLLAETANCERPDATEQKV